MEGNKKGAFIAMSGNKVISPENIHFVDISEAGYQWISIKPCECAECERIKRENGSSFGRAPRSKNKD